MVYNSDQVQNTGLEGSQNVTSLASSMEKLSILCPVPKALSQAEPISVEVAQRGKIENEILLENQDEEEQIDKDAKDSLIIENAVDHHDADTNEEKDGLVEKCHSDNSSQEEIKTDEQKELNSDREGNCVHVTAVAVDKKTSKVCSESDDEKNEEDKETDEEDDKEEMKEKNKYEEEVGGEDHSDDENPADDDEPVTEGKRQPRLLRRGWEVAGSHQPQHYAQQNSFPGTHWQNTFEGPVSASYNYSVHTHGYACSGSPQYAQPAYYPEMSFMQGGVTEFRVNNTEDEYDSSSDHSSSDSGSHEQDTSYQPVSGDQINIEHVIEVIERVMNDQEITPVPVKFLKEMYDYFETPAVVNQEFTGEVPAEQCDLPSPNFHPTEHVNASNNIPISLTGEAPAEQCDLPSPNFQLTEHVNASNNIPISHSQDYLVLKSPYYDWKVPLDKTLLHHYRKILAKQTNEKLTSQDGEGDTISMIVACEKCNGVGYMEKLVATLERQRDIPMCCKKIVSMDMVCDECGNTDENTFHSSLGMKNNEGHSILSSVVKMKHPLLVIDYIIENIKFHQSDVQLLSDINNLNFYHFHRHLYPPLSQFLPY